MGGEGEGRRTAEAFGDLADSGGGLVGWRGGCEGVGRYRSGLKVPSVSVVEGGC